MNAKESDENESDEYATRVLKACIEHGRNLLTLQLKEVEGRNYDFEPHFQKLITEIFLVGVMWRFGEQFDLPTNARDRAFVCLMQMLVTDGMSLNAAKQRIRMLNEFSRDKDGSDGFAISVAYKAGEKEGALAAIFDEYRKSPGASGAPYRLVDRSKPIAAILAIAGIAISLLIDRSWGEALGIGLVLGLATFSIALALYHQMIKKRPSVK